MEGWGFGMGFLIPPGPHSMAVVQESPCQSPMSDRSHSAPGGFPYVVDGVFKVENSILDGVADVVL